MIKRIVLGYDGSSSADRAFDFALDMARTLSASLLVISVAQPPEFSDDVETEAVLESAHEHFKRRFAVMRKRAADVGVTTHFEVVVGHPAEQLVLRAKKHKAELIVLGHRGKSRLPRWKLGSVSKRVTAYANCAVVVVR
jgi:nucleotide-binding universal stress UspA family protein